MPHGSTHSTACRPDPLRTRVGRDLAKSLRTWNWAVAGVHGTSFLVLLIITLTQLGSLLSFPVWTDFGQTINVLFTTPISATLLPFPFITACFHVAQALGVADYYRSSLVTGVTPHRWLEYMITNGLMTVSVFALSGAGNIMLPVTGILLNILMNLFGYLHEMLNSKRQRSLALVWWGFVPWLPLWYIPITYYLSSPVSLPVFYPVAIFGTFAFSFAFVAPLIYRYTTSSPDIVANYNVERAYLVLSLTAKLFLDWTVTIGSQI